MYKSGINFYLYQRLTSLAAQLASIFENCCPLLTTVVSGSPILQDGKLVGAVTHVLINDPLRGYGIFIDRMVE